MKVEDEGGSAKSHSMGLSEGHTSLHTPTPAHKLPEQHRFTVPRVKELPLKGEHLMKLICWDWFVVMIGWDWCVTCLLPTNPDLCLFVVCLFVFSETLQRSSQSKPSVLREVS